jgi:hypothetical protein
LHVKRIGIASTPAGSAVWLAPSSAATMTGTNSSWPVPPTQASLAGMTTVTVPAATCVVR